MSAIPIHIMAVKAMAIVLIAIAVGCSGSSSTPTHPIETPNSQPSISVSELTGSLKLPTPLAAQPTAVSATPVQAYSEPEPKDISDQCGRFQTQVSTMETDIPWYRQEPLPLSVYNLFDLGTVDANNDGVLDIFTTAHSSEQQLLIIGDDGVASNEYSTFGLDQDRGFPGLEDSDTEPEMDALTLNVMCSTYPSV